MADNNLMNFQGVKEKITEKVKVSFFELLPDDKFTELVNSEIKAFFESTIEDFEIKSVKERSYSYGSDSTVNVKLTTPISPFRAIVWGECKALVIKKLDTYFTDEGFATIYNGIYDANSGTLINTVSLTDKLKDELKVQASSLAAIFFERMFADAFNRSAPNIIQAAKDQIRNGY